MDADVPGARKRDKGVIIQMHKRKFLIGALCAAFAVSMASVAYGAQTHSVGINVKPKQLPNSKKKRAPIRLGVLTETKCPDCPSGGTPSPATRTQLDLDNALKLFPGVSPKCSVAQVQGKSTEGAKASCPRSIVGAGSATVFVPTSLTTHETYTAEVTAFNGTPQGGRPTLLLHNYVRALSFPQDLVGVIRAARGGPDFRRGNQLDVVIPPLPLGAVLTRFFASVGNGFKRGYVKSNCSDRNKRINMRSKNTYQNGTSLRATARTRCR